MHTNLVHKLNAVHNISLNGVGVINPILFTFGTI